MKYFHSIQGFYHNLNLIFKQILNEQDESQAIERMYKIRYDLVKLTRHVEISSPSLVLMSTPMLRLLLLSIMHDRQFIFSMNYLLGDTIHPTSVGPKGMRKPIDNRKLFFVTHY